MGFIIFGGVSSRDVDLEVETFPSYTSPKRKYDKISVPGRSGDIIVDNVSWENVTRTYSVSVGSLHKDYTEMVNRVIEWLHPSYTYARLEDSYEPDFYRMAVFLEEIEFSNLFNQGSKADIAFDCKPQRFLKLGDETVTITNGQKILNPTAFESRPIITVTNGGSQGNLVVGEYTVTVTGLNQTLIIDSDMQDVHFQNQNKNDLVKLSRGFPLIPPGETAIGFSGGITKVEVIPKWFTI